MLWNMQAMAHVAWMLDLRAAASRRIRTVDLAPRA